MLDQYTPLHNEVLEALCMINLSPYETRVLFAIWRKTYGFIDRSTGLRKKVDYIALSQFVDLTGLDKRHVSRALKGLKTKNIISRDDKKTGFSKQFMKLMSSVEMIKEETSSVETVPVEMMTTPSRDDKSSSVEGDTKENKETNTKEIVSNETNVNVFLKAFETVNPSYKQLFANKTQRLSALNLLDKYGVEEMGKLLKALPEIIQRPYAPIITTPYELEVKMGKLLAFLKQDEAKNIKNSLTSV